MMTHGWTFYSKNILTLLAAITLLGLSACGDDDENGGVDHCADVTCEAPAASCQGDNAITYVGTGTCNPDDGICSFTEIAQTTDCSETGEICFEGACVDADTDLCEGISCDAPPAASCQGDNAITYSGSGTCQPSDGTCDYDAVAETTDCSETDEICFQGACIPADTDLCERVSCIDPADSCDGDFAVSYSGEGTCQPEDGTCDYSDVETRVDCSESDEICFEGACVPADTDLCEDNSCEAPVASCDGNFAVSYSGDGTCQADDGTCDFADVETRVDCGETSQVCDAGACVDADTDDHSVNPGDLVITEFMANPANVNDDFGEYFEVYNKTSRTLYLNGLTVKDEGSNAFEVTNDSGDPIAVAPLSYFVFGINADTSLNGGVTVDYEYGSEMALANGDDEIIIVLNAGATDEAIIATVAYGPATDFPSISAAISTQLGAEQALDSVDSNDGALWCNSRDKIDPTSETSDLGTPGAANVDCTLPAATVTIQDLQDDSSADHPPVGTPVTITGVTITALSGDHAWAQDAAGGPFSGIYLNVSSSDTSALSVGDIVDIAGTYTEAYNVTTVDAPVFSAAASGTPLEPEYVSSSAFADPATAEPWEGVLIRIAKPGVTNENPDLPANHNEFRLDATLRVDDQLYDYNAAGHQPTQCDTFDQVSGVVHFSFSNYKLLPRDAADFPAPGALDISTDNTLEVSSLRITPADICVDPGTEVNWEAGFGGAKELVESDPVTGDALAAPTFSGTVGGISGFSYTFDTAGITHYRAETGISSLIGNGRVIVVEAP